jgi:hypothetical protein
VRLAGTLHVSLPTDIIQLFGTGSVPVIVAGSVLGVFELGERFASQRAKDALSKWLLSFDVQKAKALPDGTQELFERIFGERHFSLRCFFRSMAFSLGAMVVIGILVLLIDPKGLYYYVISTKMYDWVEVGLWLPWSIVVDYVSLFKTRVILRILTRLRLATTGIAMVILAIDYIVYYLLFTIGAYSVTILALYVTGGADIIAQVPRWIDAIMRLLFIPPGLDEAFGFILFWSGFIPSIWMWLYVLALFVTRLFLRSEKLVTWLRWFLDVEKNPFRSIGAVAATLAFIASVAIILVSAEVSRISTAS